MRAGVAILVALSTFVLGGGFLVAPSARTLGGSALTASPVRSKREGGWSWLVC
jgi:hypothetical protein